MTSSGVLKQFPGRSQAPAAAFIIPLANCSLFFSSPLLFPTAIFFLAAPRGCR